VGFEDGIEPRDETIDLDESKDARRDDCLRVAR